MPHLAGWLGQVHEMHQGAHAHASCRVLAGRLGLPWLGRPPRPHAPPLPSSRRLCLNKRLGATVQDLTDKIRELKGGGAAEGSAGARLVGSLAELVMAAPLQVCYACGCSAVSLPEHEPGGPRWATTAGPSWGQVGLGCPAAAAFAAAASDRCAPLPPRCSSSHPRWLPRAPRSRNLTWPVRCCKPLPTPRACWRCGPGLRSTAGAGTAQQDSRPGRALCHDALGARCVACRACGWGHTWPCLAWLHPMRGSLFQAAVPLPVW